MAVKLLFNGIPQFEDSSGNPYNAARLFFYAAGSSTKQNTYSDSAGAVANDNPIVLNSSGYPAVSGSIVQIWGTVGQSYKIGLAAPGSDDPPASFIWTSDNVTPINDTTVSVDQWVSGPAPTYVSATSFTLVGDQTSTFQVGRRVKTTNTAGSIYSTVLSSAFGAVTTIVVANDSGSLDSGLSAVSYGLLSNANTSEPAIGDDKLCQGRLTLTSGTPVTTSDVTAAETVYFTPFRGNKIDLYDSTNAQWVRVPFSELSLDVPDATQMNDVFIYLSSGVLTLEAVAWTNDTTRATALTTQNGVLVKSGAVGRRYLGSFYGTTAGNGQTEDSIAKRYVWNYYNRVGRDMKAGFTANRTTTSTSGVEVDTEIRCNFVVGVVEEKPNFRLAGVWQNSGTNINQVYISIDALTTDSLTACSLTAGANSQPFSITNDVVVASAGLHYATLFGFVNAGTATFIGAAAQSARCILSGVVRG